MVSETATLDIHNPRVVREKGFAALHRELGPVGTVYFLRQFYVGHGNWTEERQKVLANATMEDIEKKLAALRGE
jgi:hypothetical protein